ncbi:MAG: tetratricopeptide repeat protein [Planctomycetota bacterium]
MPTRILLGIVLTAICGTTAVAQDANQEFGPDVQRAVRDGMAETLESQFRGGRTPQEIHLIAQAYCNRARRARKAGERAQALEKADERYLQWIEALQKAARGDSAAKADVDLAAAGVEYAGILMGLQAAGELDQFEVTAGQRGDRELLVKILSTAREQYTQSGQVVDELYEQRNEREDEFLAAGIYDTIIQLKLDITFNLGWANYYLGMVEPKDEQQRREALRRGEAAFQDLINSGQSGQMLYQCHLGLAMVQRELKRYDEAERNFSYALQEGVAPGVEAQVRYELARCHIASGKYDEARTVLRPLLEKADQELPAEERAIRFYLNLAQLWDANSHLVESENIRAQAANSAARTAILRQAQRVRETGLVKLNRLAAKGGPWPAIVQIYIATSVNLREDPAKLSPTELLYSAKQLNEAQRYKEALRRLEEALGRPEYQKAPAEQSAEDKEIAGQLLMELGKCHYQLDKLKQAAETFSKLAAQYRGHDLAPQAATFAYQLWVEIARKSERPEDYARLADTLLNLIRNYPDHPDRDEAAWLLPVAWQAAGSYQQAADEFAKIPPQTKHWEEAQYRRGLCGRLAVEARRATLSAEEYSGQARRAADQLRDYADDVMQRAAELTPTEAEDMVKYSAEARVNAAELLASRGVEQYEPALAAVAEFEQKYADSKLMGRVLAVRIRSYRGLREFERATQILEQYLQAVPAKQAGAVLASLARGMQEEVERLVAAGQAEAARQLASESVDTFTQLEQWLKQDPQRARNVPVVAFGRAQMLHIAGRPDEARRIVADLLKQSPQNGNYQRLLAQILVEQLTEASSVDEVKAAQDAWAELLKDPSLRKRAPERFWEARYNWLMLLLRAGNAADVESAIKQELVWYPDLGGPPWQAKLLELRKQARVALGLPEVEPPIEEPAEEP